MKMIEGQHSKYEWLNRLKKRNMLTGSEAVIRSLLIEDVETVFGIPGGSVLNFYDGIPNTISVLANNRPGCFSENCRIIRSMIV